jgi:hypothetical protein
MFVKHILYRVNSQQEPGALRHRALAEVKVTNRLQHHFIGSTLTVHIIKAKVLISG